MSTEFEKRLNKLWEDVGDNKIMVLATSSHKRVSARPMSVVMFDDKFYFQTDKEYLKYDQIKKNSNVALSFENVSVEGECRELGNPLKDEKFCELYENSFEHSFKAYTHLPTEVLFEVEPKLIKLWIYENGVPFLEKLDFENKEYEKIRQGE